MYLHDEYSCTHMIVVTYLHDLSNCHASACRVACIHMTTHARIHMTPTIFDRIGNFPVFVHYRALMVDVTKCIYSYKLFTTLRQFPSGFSWYWTFIKPFIKEFLQNKITFLYKDAYLTLFASRERSQNFQKYSPVHPKKVK